MNKSNMEGYVVRKTFVIMEIRDNRLMIPKDSCGDSLFSRYGSSSYQEAIDEIILSNRVWRDFCIIEQICIVPKEE